MFEFFRKIKNVDIKLDKLDRSNERKEKFQRYKSLVESNSNKIQIAKFLISVIVEHMNFSEAVQALESEHEVQDNSLIEEIYMNIENELLLEHCLIESDGIIEGNKKFHSRNDFKRADKKYSKININELPILLNPWNGNRVIDNLVAINEKNVFDGITYSFNIQNHYLYPMSIIVCNGGNHSQFAARIKNQGYTIIKESHNYSKIYDLVEFNGENYIKSMDKTIIELNYDKNLLFYSGVIFEMGRYILENE